MSDQTCPICQGARYLHRSDLHGCHVARLRQALQGIQNLVEEYWSRWLPRRERADFESWLDDVRDLLEPGCDE